MKLKEVYVDMEKQFGELTFAGSGDEISRRINGRVSVQSRDYHLYSSVARAEDVIVRIPGNVGVKNFDYEDEVQLINPRLEAEGYTINNRGLTRFVLVAENMLRTDEK